MMFSSLVNKSKKMDSFLILLIESTDLSVFFFELSGGKYLITDKKHFYQNRTHKATEQGIFARLTSALSKFLREHESRLIKSASKDRILMRHPRQAYCFYSSPFAFSKLLTYEKHENKPFLLDSKLMESMLEEKEREFRSYIAESEKTSKKPAPRIETMERRLVQTSINGYSVTEYLGREARKFETKIIFSGIKADLRQRIGDTVHSVFRNAVISSYTTESSIFSVLSSLLPDVHNYIYCLIYGALTQVFLVKGGLPTDQIDFPLGGDKIFEEFSKRYSMPKPIIESYIKLYKENKLHGPSAEHLESVIKEIAGQWSKELLLSISKISGEAMLPKFLFILPAGETEMLLADTAKKSDSALISPASQFAVDTIDQNKIGVLEQSGDGPYALLSILAKFALPK